MLLTKNYQMIKQVLLGNTGYGNVYLRNYAKYNSQSIENNTSNVSVQLRIYTEGAYWFQQSGGYWAIGLTDNDVVNGQANQQFNVGETVIATLTGNVKHKDDGSMVCSCLGSVDFLEWGWKGTVDEEATLPTIPRATASPNLDGYIESSIAIALNPASSSFKHRIYYSYNGKTGYYPSSTGFFANTGSLTLDTSFYDYTPKATGTGTITLYTYNSAGTLIGSKTSTLTVRCDSSKCKPTISATIIDVNETTKALTGNNAKLIKGYSNAQITYTITPRNGASISNKTINGSTLGTSPFVLNKVSTSTFNIVATDSRGFSTTLTKTNTLVDYIPLSLSLTAFRPTPTGSVIKVNFEGNYFNQSFGSVQNTLELSWKYKLKESADWIDGGTLVQDTDYKISGNKFYSGSGSSVSDITLNGDFPYDNVYDIAFYYKDKLISNGVQQKTIPKGIPILNWNKDEVDVNGDLYVDKDITVNDIYSIDICPDDPNSWEQGSMDANGFVSMTTRIITKNGIPINSSTYYHFTIENTSYAFLNGVYFDENKQIIGDIYEDNNAIIGATDIVIKTPSNAKYMKPIIRNKDNTSVVTPSEITYINAQIKKFTDIKNINSEIINAKKYISISELDTTGYIGYIQGGYVLMRRNISGNLVISGGNSIYFRPLGSTNTTGEAILDKNGTLSLKGELWLKSSKFIVFGARNLYQNDSGTTGTVTLSETSANYPYLEIYYGKGGSMNVQKVYTPNGKTINLSTSIYASTGFQTVSKQMKISGTSITAVSGTYGYGNIYPAGTVQTASENAIVIYKVLGYSQ